MTAPVALLAGDLLIRSAVDDAARSTGRRVRVLSSPDRDTLAALEPGTLLIVDLSHPDVVRLLRETWPADSVVARGVAFGPHVHTERLDAARHAGFGRVLSRGGFLSQVRRLVADTDGNPPPQST